MTALNFGSTALAEDSDEVLLANGMWRDPSTGLIWMRCIFGQKWVDGKCIGSESKMSFKDAVLSIDAFEFGGNSDWRIPTHGEMLTIAEENIGRYNIKYIQGYKYKNVFFPSSAGFSRGRFEGREYGKFINLKNNLDFGSTDPEQGYGDVFPYDVNLHRDGTVGLVRAVRSGGGSSGAFEAAISEIHQADEQKRLRNIKEAEESAERERQYEKERIAAEQQEKIRLKQEQERFKREAVLPPQAMYLQAGKYDRSGQQSDAVRLYELLIEKYPNHALAVQANNRLVGVKSENDAASAASNRASAERSRASAERSRASADCKNRKRAYMDSCLPLPDGGVKYACWDRAKALCSE